MVLSSFQKDKKLDQLFMHFISGLLKLCDIMLELLLKSSPEQIRNKMSLF